MIMNDATIDPSQKVRMTINLPAIPENMHCPICEKFFSSRSACEDHVFGDCLYLQSFESDERSAVDAQIWLTRVFRSNGEDYSDFIDEMYEKWSIIVCKYCDEKFAGEDDLMRHFRSSHSDSSNLDGAVCLVCNYSALYDEKLGKHVIAKHLRCGCGLTKFKDFYSLKLHAKSCKETKDDFVRCPICCTMVSLDSENSLIDHLARCKPIFETVNFDDSGLFFECDVCLRSVSISNVDCHLRRHVGRRDAPHRRQKRVWVRLDKIKNYVNSHEFRALEELCSKQI